MFKHMKRAKQLEKEVIGDFQVFIDTCLIKMSHVFSVFLLIISIVQ